jgi:hypothetical protein
MFRLLCTFRCFTCPLGGVHSNNDDDGWNTKINDGLLLVESSVTIATPKSKSVRTTIPEVIATHHRMKLELLMSSIRCHPPSIRTECK